MKLMQRITAFLMAIMLLAGSAFAETAAADVQPYEEIVSGNVEAIVEEMEDIDLSELLEETGLTEELPGAEESTGGASEPDDGIDPFEGLSEEQLETIANLPEGFSAEIVAMAMQSCDVCAHTGLYVWEEEEDWDCVPLDDTLHLMTGRVVYRHLECSQCQAVIQTIQTDISIARTDYHNWDNWETGAANRLVCFACDAQKTVKWPCSHKKLECGESGIFSCPKCGKKAAINTPQANCDHEDITVYYPDTAVVYYGQWDAGSHLKTVSYPIYEDLSWGIDADCNICGEWIVCNADGSVDYYGNTDRISWESNDTSSLEAHTFVNGACTGCNYLAEECAHTYENGRCKACGMSAEGAIIVENALTLGAGEKYTLTAESTYGAELVYYSENSKIVSVGARTGRITAKKTGIANIVVIDGNGGAATCTVTVKKAPSGVKPTRSKITLGVGETFTIGAKLSANSASNKIGFSSAKKSVATVDGSGLITAVKPGTAKITVKTFNGKKGTATVTVKPAPEVVTVTPDTDVISVGQTTALTTRLTTAAGKTAGGAYTYSYTCEPAGCATVEDGVVTAFEAGTVTVTATTYNDLAKGSAVITIKPAPDRAAVDIEDMTITLGVKEKFQLRPYAANGSPADFIYGTENKSVATVSASGKIAAKKKGVTNITIEPHLGEAAVVTVNVVSAPKSVKLSAKKLTLGVGETAGLTAKLSSGSASALKWKSSKSSVVSVDAEGNLTAKKTGKATITVSTFNGKKATCTVTVKKAPASLSLKAGTAIMSVGQKVKFTSKVNSGAAGGCTYSATPSGILSFDGAYAEAKEPGTVTVTATTYNGIPATVEIEVLPAPDAVKVENTAIELGTKEKITLEPEIVNGSPADYTYTSSDTSVATVSRKGVVTAKKKGTVEITVVPHLGMPAVVTLTVKAAPAKVTLSQKKATIGANETLSLEATLSSGSASKLTWKSSNKNIATVDSLGNVTPLKPGKVTITATTYNGKSASCALTITQPMASDTYEGIDLYAYKGVSISTFRRTFTGLSKVPTTDGTTEYYHEYFIVGTYFGESAVNWVDIRKVSPYTICGVFVGMDVGKADAKMAAAGWNLTRTTQYAYLYSNSAGETASFGYTDGKVTSVSYSVK